MAKMYFKGGKGISKPVDYGGNEIKEGDLLTHCWFDSDYVSFFRKHTNKTKLSEINEEIHKPSVVVKYNSDKNFFYGEGITNNTYMHDFRFKYTKIVK
jgi:hypothetical protein